MKADVYNKEGSKAGTVELPEAIFGVKMNPDLVAQVINATRANARQTTAHTKGRSEVRGGGKKPWRQKGTGRSRHSSSNSPIWKGGGVTFGPTKERNFSQRINTKMRRKALFMALSSKVADSQYAVVEAIDFKEPKTKDMDALVTGLSKALPEYKATKQKRDNVLIITANKDRMAEKSASNLPNVEVTSADTLNALKVLTPKYIVFAKDAVDVMEKTYNK